LALTEICLLAVLSVWLFTPIQVRCLSNPAPCSKGVHQNGGLGYNPMQIGTALAVYGIAGGIGAFWISPRLEVGLGTVGAYRLGTLGYPVAFVLLPIGNALARRTSGTSMAVLSVLGLLLVVNILGVCVFRTSSPSLTVNSASRLPRWWHVSWLA
jgi:hypothetical protein